MPHAGRAGELMPCKCFTKLRVYKESADEQSEPEGMLRRPEKREPTPHQAKDLVTKNTRKRRRNGTEKKKPVGLMKIESNNQYTTSTPDTPEQRVPFM